MLVELPQRYELWLSRLLARFYRSESASAANVVWYLINLISYCLNEQCGAANNWTAA
jgi:hypothetical protein